MYKNIMLRRWQLNDKYEGKEEKVMRKLVRKQTFQREAVLAFVGCNCGCDGNCYCPNYPMHQIGINNTDQARVRNTGLAKVDITS